MLAVILLIVTFFIGVLFLLGGSVVFIVFSLRGHQPGGGITVKIGEWFEISTTQASLGLVIVGLALVLTGIFGVVRLQGQSEDLESLLQVAKNQVKGNVAFVKVPFNRLSESETPGTTEERNVQPYEKAQSEVLESMSQILFNEELAKTLVGSLQSDTFGLVEIPSAQIGAVEPLVRRAATKYRRNSELVLDAANFYRSIYRQTGEASYLGQWSDLAFSVLEDKEELDGSTRADAYGLAALSFQAKHDYGKALELLYLAENTVPPDKRYKLVFNICNNLYQEGDLSAAELRCQEATQLAKNQGIEFWQPPFTLGLIYLQQDRVEQASHALLEAHRAARAVGEGDSMEGYLVSQPEEFKVARLCDQETFRTELGLVCEAAPEAGRHQIPR